MADNNKIKVDELNFDGIKTNLKNFLKGQKQFKDYDFEGSNLSVLVDLLAYNTYYNSIYNNLALNEMFLDSASKRDSVVSIAKMLGYTPRSARSSKAVVNVSVSFPGGADNIDQLFLPKYTTFTSAIDDEVYYFTNPDERIATKNASGNFVFSRVALTEGRVVRQQYVAEPGVKFIISNANADTSTLKVYVSDTTTTGDPVVFTLADNIISIGNTSSVYFLKEIEDGMYEVTFGNGVIGKALANGNMVTLEYIVSNGVDSNGCKLFQSNFSSFAPGSVIRLTTVNAASGGSDIEDVSSIKFNAPRAFFTQNRAVTNSDYSSIIYQNFDNAKSISVWGGEENDPKVYGKVFISIKPKNGQFLTDDEKLILKNQVLRPKSMVTVQTELVDPTYLNIEVNTSVYYAPRSTTKSAATIADLVKSTITNYNTNTLQRFGAVFKQSRLSRLIDSTEASIQSNITTIKLRREVDPKFNTNAQYIVSLGNPIYSEGVPEESFTTTGFYLQDSDAIYYMRDDGIGNVVLYYLIGTEEVIVNKTIGTINYTKGLVTINGLNISAIDGNALEFIFKPSSYDVVSIRNQILDIPSANITVNMIVDGSGSGYTFTASR